MLNNLWSLGQDLFFNPTPSAPFAKKTIFPFMNFLFYTFEKVSYVYLSESESGSVFCTIALCVYPPTSSTPWLLAV